MVARLAGVLQVRHDEAVAGGGAGHAVRRGGRAPQGRVLHRHPQDAQVGVRPREHVGGRRAVVWMLLGLQPGLELQLFHYGGMYVCTEVCMDVWM